MVSIGHMPCDFFLACSVQHQICLYMRLLLFASVMYLQQQFTFQSIVILHCDHRVKSCRFCHSVYKSCMRYVWARVCVRVCVCVCVYISVCACVRWAGECVYKSCVWSVTPSLSPPGCIHRTFQYFGQWCLQFGKKSGTKLHWVQGNFSTSVISEVICSYCTEPNTSRNQSFHLRNSGIHVLPM